MKHKAVIFDLGNTLVSYYTNEQWPAILEQSIGEVARHLRQRGLMRVDPGELAARVQAERGESADHRVKPLEERLGRIFKLEPGEAEPVELCRLFIKPIFSLARRYDDVLPTLDDVRRRGLRIGILSNTSWGSPAELWREELHRHGLHAMADAAAFCRDCGWRKPAPQPFQFLLGKLGLAAGQCVFVGDDPRWDIDGPRAIGMDAVLIDRTGSAQFADERPIRSLAELMARVGEF